MPNLNPHRQIEMHSGPYRLVANLSADTRLRTGVKLTLKGCGDPEQLWTVDRVYAPLTDKASLHITGAWWTIK
jgi:hypothetical protein